MTRPCSCQGEMGGLEYCDEVAFIGLRLDLNYFVQDGAGGAL